jgi:hypothetical protein
MSGFDYAHGMHPVLDETIASIPKNAAPGLSDNNVMPLFKYQPPPNSAIAPVADTGWRYQPANMGVTGVPAPVTPTMAPQGVQKIESETPFQKAMGTTAGVAGQMLLRQHTPTPATVMAGRAPTQGGKIQLGATIKRSSPLERYSRFLQGMK